MLTQLVIIILCVLGICVSLLDIYRTYIEPLKERIKNLLEENDALLKVNYKLAKEIDKLIDEVQTYRNSFNHE